MLLKNNINDIAIYTDGSCHTQYKIGAWAALIVIDNSKILLQDIEKNTTHNRMELLGFIKALEYLHTNSYKNPIITFYSDSQYLVNLITREKKLTQSNFTTKKGNEIRNSDLVKTILLEMNCWNITIQKVKAHQKKNHEKNYNRIVDMACRKLVRDSVKKLDNKI